VHREAIDGSLTGEHGLHRPAMRVKDYTVPILAHWFMLVTRRNFRTDLWRGYMRERCLPTLKCV
jgi:hypothetical protein